jgi:hypothetical protein
MVIIMRTKEICPELVLEIQELLAQPEQEPVAWMQDDIELYVQEEKDIVRGYVIPLYTAPQKREPLSLEELCKLYGDNVVEDIFTFARAIEKAHGIGGGE